MCTALQAVASPLGHSTAGSDTTCNPRADDGIRTRDPHLGKVMRYQLRYIREPRTRSSPVAKHDDSPREPTRTTFSVPRPRRPPLAAQRVLPRPPRVLTFDVVHLLAPVPWLSGRASASHAEGRWFEPSRDHQHYCRSESISGLNLVRVGYPAAIRVVCCARRDVRWTHYTGVSSPHRFRPLVW